MEQINYACKQFAMLQSRQFFQSKSVKCRKKFLWDSLSIGVPNQYSYLCSVLEYPHQLFPIHLDNDMSWLICLQSHMDQCMQ